MNTLTYLNCISHLMETAQLQSCAFSTFSRIPKMFLSRFVKSRMFQDLFPGWGFLYTSACMGFLWCFGLHTAVKTDIIDDHNSVEHFVNHKRKEGVSSPRSLPGHIYIYIQDTVYIQYIYIRRKNRRLAHCRNPLMNNLSS